AQDSIKRAFNQAIFERILVSPDCTVTAEYTAPFAALLAPLTQAKSATVDGGENTLVTGINEGVFSQFLPQETAKHPSKFFGGCLNKAVMVGVQNFEPSPCSVIPLQSRDVIASAAKQSRLAFTPMYRLTPAPYLKRISVGADGNPPVVPVPRGTRGDCHRPLRFALSHEYGWAGPGMTGSHKFIAHPRNTFLLI
ncbi:MAG: hypothetical protein LBK56_02350, partial [Gracilibacteraceae bacterium]|nr:hypothetical protein [Gracilibacteraceae bacterium]